MENWFKSDRTWTFGRKRMASLIKRAGPISYSIGEKTTDLHHNKGQNVRKEQNDTTAWNNRGGRLLVQLGQHWMPVFHTGMSGLCPCSSASDLASRWCALWEAADDGSTCVPAIQVGDLLWAVDSWFQYGSALAVVGTWGVNQHVEDLCLYPSFK